MKKKDITGFIDNRMYRPQSATEAIFKAQQPTALRDKFAMAALTGILSNPECDTDPESISHWCYKYADAMLKEREQQNENNK